jgi:hypothetical protein
MADPSNHKKQREETISLGGYYPLKCFQNAWHDCFFIHHDLTGKDDVPAVDSKRKLGNVEEDCLETLLQTSGNSGSPSQADGVKRYCKSGPELEAVEQGLGEAGARRAAWVDDRNSPSLTKKGSVRLCGTWLTAMGLLRYLRKAV